MSVPNHLLYTKDHEWIDFKDEYAIVGITDYAQSQLGDVIFVEFPEIGRFTFRILLWRGGSS